jgi:hypothetical protein
MWVYYNSNNPNNSLTGNSLTNRSKLDQKLGFWLDYWLFLHSDTTHRLWAARPFGIRAIIQAAEQSKGRGNEVLRRAIRVELNDCLKLFETLDCTQYLRPPKSRIDQGDQEWDNDWLNWFDKIAKFLASRDLEAQLICGISKALCKTKYKRAMKLTQGLAAELGGDGFTARQLLRSAKNSLCDSGEYNDRNFLKPEELEEAIKSALLDGTESRYQVELAMPSVNIRSKSWNQVSYSIKLEDPSNCLLGTKIDYKLEGFSLKISAVHPEEALVKSLEIAKVELAKLRNLEVDNTFVLVKTKSIVNLTTNESEPKNLIPNLPKTIFRHPTKGSLNDVKIKLTSKMPKKIKKNFGIEWIENPHEDCERIWSTLESYSPKTHDGTLKSVVEYAKSSLDYLPNEMRCYLVNCLMNQRFARKQSQLTYRNWKFWDRKPDTLIAWKDEVFNERSRYFHEKWEPSPPSLLFHPGVGLLHDMTEKTDNMTKTLEKNLNLLYGLRNKVAHTGEGSAILPDSMARYLGRFALETLYLILNKQEEEENREQKQLEQLNELEKEI